MAKRIVKDVDAEAAARESGKPICIPCLDFVHVFTHGMTDSACTNLVPTRVGLQSTF